MVNRVSFCPHWSGRVDFFILKTFLVLFQLRVHMTFRMTKAISSGRFLISANKHWCIYSFFLDFFSLFYLHHIFTFESSFDEMWHVRSTKHVILIKFCWKVTKQLNVIQFTEMPQHKISGFCCELYKYLSLYSIWRNFNGALLFIFIIRILYLLFRVCMIKISKFKVRDYFSFNHFDCLFSIKYDHSNI